MALWLTQRQLKSKNTAVRRRAALRLSQKPGSGDLRLLQAALEDQDPEVRRLVTTALGKLKAEGRIEPLLTALRDSDPEVQKAAIQGLRAGAVKQSIGALVPLLQNADGAVRAHAAQALADLGWRPEKPEEQIWMWIAQAKFSRAAAFGVKAIPALGMVLGSGPYSLSLGAIQGLSEINDAASAAPLLRALRSEDPAICSAAASALAKLGCSQAVETIIQLLRHSNAQVRLAAVEALGSLNAAMSAPSLRKLLDDPAWDVRRAAAQTLGKFKDVEAVEALATRLKDSDADVREATAMSLGGLSDRRAIGPLVMALKDSTSDVRRLAAASLSRIDKDWTASAEARSALAALKPALEEQSPEIRHFIGNLLKEAGQPEVISAQRNSEPLPIAVLEGRKKLAVSILLAVLCDDDPDLRQAAAHALGKLEDARAEPALRQAAQDADEAVRLTAQAALESMRRETNLDMVPTFSQRSGPSRIREMLLCSAQGEVLYEWKCRSVEGRCLLLAQVEQQALELHDLMTGGAFDRLEIIMRDGRVVCQARADRRIFVHSSRLPGRHL